MKVWNIKQFDQYPDWQRICEVYPEVLYIGRRNASMGLPESPLANRFKIGEHGNRAQVIEMYRHWLWQRIKLGDRSVIDVLLAMEPNTKLVCWCAPLACHGDIVMAAAQWVQAEEAAGRLKTMVVHS